LATGPLSAPRTSKGPLLSLPRWREGEVMQDPRRPPQAETEAAKKLFRPRCPHGEGRHREPR
jgi:hypothetical protein